MFKKKDCCDVCFRETQYSTASNYNMFREFRPFEDDEVDMVIKRLHESVTYSSHNTKLTLFERNNAIISICLLPYNCNIWCCGLVVVVVTVVVVANCSQTKISAKTLTFRPQKRVKPGGH